MLTKKTINTLIASAVAMTVAGAASEALAKEGYEKCYGVVKAGHNDCGAADKSHSCAGQAATDASAQEWIYLPTGICDKLAGGHMAGGDDAHSDMDKMDDMGDMKGAH